MEIDEVAEAISRELPQLLGPDDREEVGARLSALRTRLGEGDAVEDEIIALLAEREPTRARLDELLPASALLGDRGFEPLPGRSPIPPGVELYSCPHRDYLWPRSDVAEPVPNCPNHGIALVPIDAAEP